jgi:two-component system, NarL family, sensor histidine kinase EvgS
MKFLVVDDDSAIRHVVSSIVRLFGHDADEANDGLEAIEQLQNKRYEVVITDAQMPNIDGAKLCTFLKSQFPSTYIIGISGSSSSLKGLEQAGADICLAKPFSIHTLEEAIANRYRSSMPNYATLQPVQPAA